MKVLIVVGIVALVCVLVAAERVIKLRQQARQRRDMAYRLSTAAARAVVAERKREAAAAASAQLTSVMPAINHPKATFDGVVKQSRRPPAAHQHNTGPHQHNAGPQRQAGGLQRRSDRRVSPPEGEHPAVTPPEGEHPAVTPGGLAPQSPDPEG